MITVSITGSDTAIDRHIDALRNFDDVRVTDSWIVGGPKDTIYHAETGKKCTDPEQITDHADALILTDGGVLSNKLAIHTLRKGKHLFIYPPVIRTNNDVFQLIKLAREANVILLCGKTGSTGISGLTNLMDDSDQITMIELQHNIKISNHSHHLDIEEILLGDIEMISHLIHARLSSIKAKGVCMLSNDPEIINARLEFDNGCTVNYNCNLVAPENDHLITLILKNRILKYDLLTSNLSGWQLHHSVNKNESPIFIENIQVRKTDSLLGGLTEFFELIRSGAAFLSIYDNGFESVQLTDRIIEKVMRTLVNCA